MKNKIILSFFLSVIVSVSATSFLSVTSTPRIVERVFFYEKLSNTKTNSFIANADRLMGSDFDNITKDLKKDFNVQILNSEECEKLFLNNQNRTVFFTIDNPYDTFEVHLLGPKRTDLVLDKCERKIFSVIRKMNENLQKYYSNVGENMTSEIISDYQDDALAKLKTYLDMYDRYNYYNKEKADFYNDSFPELKSYIQEFIKNRKTNSNKYVESLKLKSDNRGDIYFLKLLEKKEVYKAELSSEVRFLSFFVISVLVIFIYFLFKKSILRKKINKYLLHVNKILS